MKEKDESRKEKGINLDRCYSSKGYWCSNNEILMVNGGETAEEWENGYFRTLREKSQSNR